jgi:phytoene dehydrogenase-like protein
MVPIGSRRWAETALIECTAKHSIKGGSRSLIAALEKAAQSQGVEIRTESEVGEVQVSGGQIKGVVLKSGIFAVAERQQK